MKHMEIKNVGLMDQEKKVLPVSLGPDVDFEGAKEAARKKAREVCAGSMMLSWYNKKTGEYYPKTQCGSHLTPVWRLYAESRGSDITVDVNKGDYVFMFLSTE
jgi:hypothetical protein